LAPGLRVQPEIEIPAGMARHNKQTSVKNRRMNPPRPALSSRGTVTPEKIGKIGLKQTSLLMSLVFACGMRLVLPEFQATDSGRWGGSKNPFARHRKGDSNWENSLSSGPTTCFGWSGAGYDRSNDRPPETHSTCIWLTRRAYETPKKSVSGRGGLRLAAGRSYPPPAFS